MRAPSLAVLFLFAATAHADVQGGAPPAPAETKATTTETTTPTTTTTTTTDAADGAATPSPPPGPAPIPLRDAQVQTAIVARAGAIEDCQRRDPAARGLLHVRFRITPAGRATAIEVLAGTLKSPAIERCVVAEISTWSLPQHAVAAGVPVDTSFGFDGVASATAATPGRPRCKPGEKPRLPSELAPGEVACVELEARPCAVGEKPLPPERLPPGQLACVELESERGVPFLKGELTRFGDVQLVNVKNSFGVGLGVATIDNAIYAQLRPDVNLHWGPFNLGLGTPLRFEVADFGSLRIDDPSSTDSIFAEVGRFRTEDWDQIEDFLRPLRYLSWGKKEDQLYLDVNRVHSVTLGHGQLVRRYTPNVDIDEDNLIAAVDGYGDYNGVELLAGPFPVPRVAGALVFVKPLALLSDDPLARSWSIGVSAATDLNAPTVLDKRQNPADQRVQLAVDSSNQLLWRGKTNPVGDTVFGAGLDSELKILKVDILDIKTYADWSQLFFPADSSVEQAFEAFSGGGATLGALVRMSFGETPVRPLDEESDDVKAGRAPREMKAAHAVRVRVEGRLFDPQYLPSYFNTMYEVDRFQYGVDEEGSRAELPTKIAFLAAQAGQPWRAGFYGEVSWAWVDIVGLTAVYEDAVALAADAAPVGGRNLALHAETTGFGFLQLFGTYHYRNFEDFSGLFSFATDHEILYAGGRLELLPFLFINAAAQRAFRVGFDDDDLSRQVDKRGRRFSSVGFENVWAGTVDVEVGWQF